MPHASNIVYPPGPDSPHAFDIVPLQPRNGMLDAPCPVCKGHGQWNSEIDLVSFRCKRAICELCHGAGWVETGTDPVGFADIVLTPEGYPQWVVRYIPHGGALEQDRTRRADPSSPAGVTTSAPVRSGAARRRGPRATGWS